ncbi:hypothetical protein C2S53_013006 [Perilla frutescens var. hirtella]|uniref:BED-type domain-containing protein n=1 Tax=Perilla frutescens var. hirtella TaxID=608512 RepID=A0AAD4IMQ3_PERFH|nr:hypothetical protein C2S53_013006 [Perilla frutescens var. hirtella]
MSDLDVFSDQGSSACPTVREVQLITHCPSEVGDKSFESGEDEEDNPHPTKKRKCTSKVWEDFTEVTLANGTVKAECIHCSCRLSFDKTGCTTHLDKHLKKCLREMVKEEKESLNLTLSESKSIASLEHFEYDHARIREILSHMIIVNELPFHFPEDELFNLLMGSVTPHYQRISSVTTKKDCLASFESEKDNLMAELNNVNRLSDVIFKVRESVKYVVASEMRINMFGEIAKQLELSSKKLVLDRGTSCNATYFMLSAALDLKDVFSKYQQRDTSYTLLPSEEEWKKVCVVCSLLEGFIESTNLTPVALDPRYKMEFIDWYFQKHFSSTEAVEYTKTVHETLHLLYNEYVEADEANKAKTPKSSSNVCGSTEYSCRFIAEYQEYLKTQPRKSELEVYLDHTSYIDKRTEFDALSWWRMNNSHFRILSKMACDVLSIPITTVALESAFIAGSKVIDPHHASLGVDTMRVLLCGGDWLRTRYGIKRKDKVREGGHPRD